jgi:hypothetical protein
MGGKVSLCLTPAREWSRSLEGATFTSDTPVVLAADGGTCPAALYGVSPGVTRLVLRDPDGAERRVFTVNVVRPDAVVIAPVGPRLLRNELPDSVTRPNLLVGSASLFVARAIASGAEPYGVGWLGGASGGGISTSGRSGDVDTLGRDLVSIWLDESVTPGAHAAAVVVAGRSLPLPVHVVPPEAIRSFSLEGPLFRSVVLFSYGFVLAEGRLADGQPVYGLPVEWAFRDGWAPNTGQVFRYTHVAGEAHPLRARWGGFEATLDVEGTGGTVIDPPRQACSAGAPMTLLGALVGAMLALLRRR